MNAFVYLASTGHMMYDEQAQPHSFMDVNYCKGGSCTQVAFQTSRGHLTKSQSIQQTKKGLIEPKRIKNRNRGLCFDVESGTEYVKISSRCRDSFYLAPDEPFLIHAQSGKRLGKIGADNNLRLVDNKEDAKIFMFTNTVNMPSGLNRRLGILPKQEPVEVLKNEYQCLGFSTANNDIVFSSIQTPKGTSFCGSILSFIQAFPQDITDKISMKSMLKISTSKGPTLFVCTPSKDLWSNSNCLYSLDDGAKWIGLTPKITELKAFISSEDSFYGLCHSAKYHCKYHVETGLLHYVTLTEYQSKLSDVNMVSITNLDDMQLSETRETTDYTDVLVSSLTLYCNVAGSTVGYFLWRNPPDY
ncbi:uncharacterized protein [Clytia hemisphaerica]|uniref:uncharacterized protein isoform X1 n=1 Tax=Clytia hemisphaerica TaxID=252671 RepID=UPI0034D5EBA7